MLRWLLTLMCLSLLGCGGAPAPTPVNVRVYSTNATLGIPLGVIKESGSVVILTDRPVLLRAYHVDDGQSREVASVPFDPKQFDVASLTPVEEQEEIRVQFLVQGNGPGHAGNGGTQLNLPLPSAMGSGIMSGHWLVTEEKMLFAYWLHETPEANTGVGDDHDLDTMRKISAKRPVSFLAITAEAIASSQ